MLLWQLLASSCMGMVPYLWRESALDLDRIDLDPILLAEAPGLIGLVSPARQSTANFKSCHISWSSDSWKYWSLAHYVVTWWEIHNSYLFPDNIARLILNILKLFALTFSSTANFLRFQENSKIAMMIEMSIPPRRTMKTPPRLARPSCALLAPCSA